MKISVSKIGSDTIKALIDGDGDLWIHSAQVGGFVLIGNDSTFSPYTKADIEGLHGVSNLLYEGDVIHITL